MKFRRKYEVDESHQLVRFARRQLHYLRLLLEWRGFPKSYEIAFVDRMEELEAEGLPFQEVLLATAPKIFGEAPGQIMLMWVGRKARQKPILFVKALKREFGNSYASVLVKLRLSVDVEGMLESKKPYVPANQYLVESMIRDGLIEP